MTDDCTIDHAVLRRLETLGGGDFVGELIGIFVEQVPRRIEAALEGVRANSLDAVHRAAHSLVSTSGHIGAQRMLRLAEALEGAADAHDWDTVRRLAPELRPAFDEAWTVLERLQPRALA
jgi:HPt (histidine-containing phosphotransfer) domain-containing protein